MTIKDHLRQLIEDAKKVWNAPGGKRPFSARYRGYDKPENQSDKSREDKGKSRESRDKP
jgi:hypothetical protein